MNNRRNTSRSQLVRLLCFLIIFLSSLGESNIQGQSAMPPAKEYDQWKSSCDIVIMAKTHLLENNHATRTLAAPNKIKLTALDFDNKSYDIGHLESVRLRKRATLGNSLGIGLAFGVGFAIITSLISGIDDYAGIRITAPQKGPLMSSPLPLIAGSTRGSAGAAKIKIPITRKMETHRSRIP